MPANYPTSPPSFSPSSTGDTIQAAHVNDLRNEVVAIGGALLNGLDHVLKPLTTDLRDLGTASLRWNALYLTKGINVVHGNLTAAQPAILIQHTWNNAAVLFTAIDMDITNTASAANSLLAHLKVGGTSMWKLDKLGQVFNANNLFFITDNAHDVGASGSSRPRDIFLGRALSVGTTAQTGSANRFRMLQSMAQATTSLELGTASGIESSISWDTETFDTDSIHSTASNTHRFVAPITGKYLFSAYVQWATNATGDRLAVVKNQAGTIMTADRRTAVSGTETHQTVSGIAALTAGDWVALYITQNSGVGVNITTNSKFSFLYVGE